MSTEEFQGVEAKAGWPFGRKKKGSPGDYHRLKREPAKPVRRVKPHERMPLYHVAMVDGDEQVDLFRDRHGNFQVHTRDSVYDLKDIVAGNTTININTLGALNLMVEADLLPPQAAEQISLAVRELRYSGSILTKEQGWSALTTAPIPAVDQGRKILQEPGQKPVKPRRPPGVPMGGDVQAEQPLYILRTGNNPLGKAGKLKVYLHGDERPPHGEEVKTGKRGGHYYTPVGSGTAPTAQKPSVRGFLKPTTDTGRTPTTQLNTIAQRFMDGDMTRGKLAETIGDLSTESLQGLAEGFHDFYGHFAGGAFGAKRAKRYRGALQTIDQESQLREVHYLHGTPVANLKAILKVGLLTDKKASNFSISKPGVVYLSPANESGRRMSCLVACAAALKAGQSQFAVLRVRLQAEAFSYDPDAGAMGVLVEHNVPAQSVVGYTLYDTAPFKSAYERTQQEFQALCEQRPEACNNDGLWVKDFSDEFSYIVEDRGLKAVREVDLTRRQKAAAGGVFVAPATLDTVKSLHAALSDSYTHAHDGLARHPVSDKHIADDEDGGSIPSADTSQALGGKRDPSTAEKKGLSADMQPTLAKHPGHEDQSVHDPRSKKGAKRVQIPKALRDAVLGDHPICTFCGTSKGPFHADHIIPVKLGGKNLKVNLQPACAACNMARRAKDPSQKLEWIKYSQKQMRDIMGQVLARPRVSKMLELWGDTLYLSVPAPADADILRKHNTPRSPHRLHDPRARATAEARFKGTKTYLAPGEQPPSGAAVEEGPRGGRYYRTERTIGEKAAGQVDRVDDEMRAAFKALGLKHSGRVPVQRGPLDRKAWNAIKRNIDAHLSEHAAYMTTDTLKLARKELSKQLGLFIKTGMAQDAKLLNAYMEHATDALAYQELHAWRRQLGDHGIRHITEDQRMADEMLRELGTTVGHVTNRDRLLAAVALTYHDIGYTAKPARETFAGTKLHPLYSSQFIRQQPVLKKLLGADMDKVCHWVETHDTSDIDWAEDPVGSAVRLSDNLALFAREKLPALFRYVPGAVRQLQAMAVDLQSGNERSVKRRKSQLRDAVDKAQLAPGMKRNLLAAVDDIFKLTPKFTLGMLAGHTLTPKFDGQTMHIPIQYSAFAKTLQDLFNMGQDQFIKLGDSYGLTPADVNKGEFTFTNKRGIPVLHCKVMGAPTGVFKHLPGQHRQEDHGSPANSKVDTRYNALQAVTQAHDEWGKRRFKGNVRWTGTPIFHRSTNAATIKHEGFADDHRNPVLPGFSFTESTYADLFDIDYARPGKDVVQAMVAGPIWDPSDEETRPLDTLTGYAADERWNKMVQDLAKKTGVNWQEHNGGGARDARERFAVALRDKLISMGIAGYHAGAETVIVDLSKLIVLNEKAHELDKHLPGKHDQKTHGIRHRRSVEQREQLGMLRTYMREIVKLRGKHKPKGWRYGSVEELLIDRGQAFSNDPYTDEEEDAIRKIAGAVGACHEKECYYNTLRAAVDAEFTGVDIHYAEGLAMAKGLPLPINHAFLVLNNKPVDLTWRRDYSVGHGFKGEKLLERARENLEDDTYIGIKVPVDFLRKRSLESGMASPVLDDWEHGSPLLQRGIPADWDKLQKAFTHEHDGLGRHPVSDSHQNDTDDNITKADSIIEEHLPGQHDQADHAGDGDAETTELHDDPTDKMVDVLKAQLKGKPFNLRVGTWHQSGSYRTRTLTLETEDRQGFSQAVVWRYGDTYTVQQQDISLPEGARGHGVGGQLMDALVAAYKAAGVRGIPIHMDTNPTFWDHMRERHPGIFKAVVAKAGWSHEHDGYPRHPVNVKYHEEYFARHAREASQAFRDVPQPVRSRRTSTSPSLRVLSGKTPGKDEFKDVQSFAAAGLSGGIRMAQTSVVVCEPDVLPSVEGLSDDRLIYKRDTGESITEFVVYKLFELLKPGFCPPVMLDDDNKGHAMRWIDDAGFGGTAKTLSESRGLRFSEAQASDAGLICVMDWLTQNPDRHDGNAIMDGDRIWPIDHGLANTDKILSDARYQNGLGFYVWRDRMNNMQAVDAFCSRARGALEQIIWGTDPFVDAIQTQGGLEPGRIVGSVGPSEGKLADLVRERAREQITTLNGFREEMKQQVARKQEREQLHGSR